MPRFQVFDADIRQQAEALGVRRATGDAFGAQVGAATAGFGATLARESAQVFDMLEQRELLETARQSAAIRRQALELADGLRDQGQPAAEQVDRFLDEQFENLTQSRTFGRSRERALTDQEQRFAEIGRVVRANDAALAAAQVSEDIESVLRDEGVVVLNEPDLFPVVADEFRRTVEGFDILTAAQKQALVREGGERLARNAVQGLINLDPDAALAELQAGKFDDFLAAESKVVMTARAEERQRTLAREEDRARREAELQKAITTDQVLTETFNAIFDPEQGLGHGDIEALSRRKHDDGTPMLQASQILQLHRLTEARSESAAGSLANNPGLAAELYPRVLRGSVSIEELTEQRAEGNISQAEFERYARFVNEGPTPLRSARSNALGRIEQRLDPDGFRFFLPNVQGDVKLEVGRVMDQLGTLMLEREEQFRQEGKNPVDYYSSDQFADDFAQAAADLEAGADRFSQGNAGEITVGSIISDGEGLDLIFIGAGDGAADDPNDLDQWVTSDSPEGRAALGLPSPEVETEDGVLVGLQPPENVAPGQVVGGFMYLGGGPDEPSNWFPAPADAEPGFEIAGFMLTPEGTWIRSNTPRATELREEFSREPSALDRLRARINESAAEQRAGLERIAADRGRE